MSFVRTASLTLLGLVLVSCGGGGGGTSPAPLPTPIAVKATSYANAKGLNLPAQQIPYSVYNNIAHAFADFFQRGQLDLFVANITYDVNRPLSEATPATFEFWKRQPNGSFVKDASILPNSVGCIHPRKAIVADFNHDGRPDVFVACTGYDGSPFPGENSVVILSQSNGLYSSTSIPFQAYMHGAAAGDIRGSGHVDIVAVNPSTNGVGHVPVLLVNDGAGNFTVRTDLLPPLNPGALYYSVEVLDLNNDAKLDILFLGDDQTRFPAVSAPTTVAINNGTGSFAAASLQSLPVVPDTIALDAVLLGRNLYLSRTSSAPADFYRTRVVQRVNLDTLASSVVDSQSPLSFPYWIEWLVPYTNAGSTSLVADDAAIPYSLAVN